MPRRKTPDSKVARLSRDHTLNPSSEKVRDELFLAHPFFDARDLMQVKYEMLRRVERKELTASKAAKTFGLSRPSFYAAQVAMKTSGLSGLLPRKRGPRGPHKLTDDVLAFVEEFRGQNPRPTLVEVLEAIETRFGKKVHRRSLERALGRPGKGHP